MATTSRDVGVRAEQAACEYLRNKGLRLLTSNYHGPRGEIDLVMQDAGTTVFVEVRYRRTSMYGSGVESVDRRKQDKLLATAAHYLQHHPEAARGACRFDVVALSPDNTECGTGANQVAWITDAFQAD